MDNRPIGIFDSGLGGLTVLSAINKLIPNENLVYFGDSGRTPYGTKSKETIVKYTIQDINFLLKKGVKMIVIACNTASACSLQTVRFMFDCPIVEVIGPGSRAAIRQTKTKDILVIGTPATVNSQIYTRTIGQLERDARVSGKACPLFVPLVEEGWWDNEISKMVAQKYLSEFRGTQIDTTILGCTHYPLLEPVIKEVLGKEVSLINSALEVAKETEKVLKEKNIQAEDRKGKIEYYTSDSVEKFTSLGNMFLNMDKRDVKKIDIEKECNKAPYYAED